MHACLPTYLPTYLPTHPPTHPPTHLLTYLPASFPAYLPTLPTYIFTCIHTYIHACMHTCGSLVLRIYLPTQLHACLLISLPPYLPTYSPCEAFYLYLLRPSKFRCTPAMDPAVEQVNVKSHASPRKKQHEMKARTKSSQAQCKPRMLDPKARRKAKEIHQ